MKKRDVSVMARHNVIPHQIRQNLRLGAHPLDPGRLRPLSFAAFPLSTGRAGRFS